MVQAVNNVHTARNCRWSRIDHRPGVRVSNWTRAVCIRPPKAPRYVTDEQCAGCEFWEPRAKRVS